MTYSALEKKKYDGLEKIRIEKPYLQEVNFTSDEVTAKCPITEQPDYYTISITIEPKEYSLESKSLKLYLEQFRNEGIFCELLALKICQDVHATVSPKKCEIIVRQKSRGGIVITAKAVL